MSEIRKDPIVGHWVIVAEERGRRPHDFHTQPTRPSDMFCPFCEGNESHTPGEILARRADPAQVDGPGWRVRVVPNKYPALAAEGEVRPQSEGLYERTAGVGAHEVIIESPRHVLSTTDLTEQEAAEVFAVYRQRLLQLKADRRLRYGLVFKNVGAAAGASLQHVHSQLIATPMVPINVVEEMSGSRELYRQRGECPWCEMIRRELAGATRVVLESPDFVAFCPFASRFPFETWVMPRRHESHFESLADDRLGQLSRLVRRLIGLLETVLEERAYNYLIHTAPFDTGPVAHYHWHIEVFPRLTKTAGFEWGTGYYINPQPPEKAAERLRADAPSKRKRN